MWPWGHLAVAYLIYSAYTRYGHGRIPRAFPTLALAVGSQLPDLIDKPLGWTLDVLPGGRTLGHSLFFAAVLFAVVYLVARRYDRIEIAAALAIGHLVHLVTDLPADVVTGDFGGAVYLLWPLLEPPEYEAVEGILAGFLRFSPTPSELIQFSLLAVAIVVWYWDGRPGLAVPKRLAARVDLSG